MQLRTALVAVTMFFISIPASANAREAHVIKAGKSAVCNKIGEKQKDESISGSFSISKRNKQVMMIHTSA